MENDAESVQFLALASFLFYFIISDGLPIRPILKSVVIQKEIRQPGNVLENAAIRMPGQSLVMLLSRDTPSRGYRAFYSVTPFTIRHFQGKRRQWANHNEITFQASSKPTTAQLF